MQISARDAKTERHLCGLTATDTQTECHLCRPQLQTHKLNVIYAGLQLHAKTSYRKDAEIAHTQCNLCRSQPETQKLNVIYAGLQLQTRKLNVIYADHSYRRTN